MGLSLCLNPASTPYCYTICKYSTILPSKMKFSQGPIDFPFPSILSLRPQGSFRFFPYAFSFHPICQFYEKQSYNRTSNRRADGASSAKPPHHQNHPRFFISPTTCGKSYEHFSVYGAYQTQWLPTKEAYPSFGSEITIHLDGSCRLAGCKPLRHTSRQNEPRLPALWNGDSDDNFASHP